MYLHRQEVVPIVVESGKGVTASEANRLLGRTGESFWQRESYDHGVRDTGELERMAAPMENNPVKAGRRSRRLSLVLRQGRQGRGRRESRRGTLKRAPHHLPRRPTGEDTART